MSLSELIQLAPLRAIQKQLLHVFLFHERGKGRCWLSSESLKHRSSLNSRQTITTHKNALRDLGVLSWLQPGHEDNEHHCCLYFLRWDRLVALVADHLKASVRSARPARAPRPPRPPAAARSSAAAAARALSGASLPHAEPPTPPCGEAACEPPLACGVSTTGAPVEPVADAPTAVEPVAAEASGRVNIPDGADALAGAAFSGGTEAFLVESTALPPEVETALPPEMETALPPEAETALPPEVEEVGEPEALAAGAGEALEAPVFPLEEPTLAMSHAAPSEEPTPAPVSTVRALAQASPRGDACGSPSLSAFQVPAELVWSCWQDAYLRAYQRPYFPVPSDRFSAASLASACRAAVLHHAPQSTPQLLLALAEQFLRHVCAAFLRLPGRDGFLQRRGHPLALLLSDLNALGSPWPRKPSVGPSLASAPKTAPPAVVPLPPQQSAARAREALALLGQGSSSVRPSPRR